MKSTCFLLPPLSTMFLLLIVGSSGFRDSHAVADPPLRPVFENMDTLMSKEGESYKPEDYVIHDPSRIVERDGYLMIAVTGKEQAFGYDCGLELWYMAPGQTKWMPGQCLLQKKPSWVKAEVPGNDGAYWAPEFFDSSTMYYSVSDGEKNTCVGLLRAEGKVPNLQWVDSGEPVTCTWDIKEEGQIPQPSSIDPATFMDADGQQWLVYGGGHIYAAKLNAQLSVDDWWEEGSKSHILLANGPGVDEDGDPYGRGETGWIEAPYIHRKDQWHYLFVNWYDCCNGPDSTYEIRVGRSKSPSGPFLDRDGIDMRNGGGTLLLHSEDLKKERCVGPGHPGIFEYKNRRGKERQVLTFHCYDKDENPWAFIYSRKISWKSGWPRVLRGKFNPREYWKAQTK